MKSTEAKLKRQRSRSQGLKPLPYDGPMTEKVANVSEQGTGRKRVAGQQPGAEVDNSR